MRYSSAVEAEWPLRILFGFTCLICRWKELAVSFGLYLVEPQALGAVVIALAHLQAKKSTERLESGKLTTTREYMMAFAPLFRIGGIGPLDVVVKGCTVLQRTLIALRASLTMSQGQPQPPPPPAAPAHGMNSFSARSEAEAEGHYTRWTDAVLGVTQVLQMIYMATTQGASRLLTTQVGR